MPRRPQTPRKAKYAPTLTRTTDRFVVKIMKDGKKGLAESILRQALAGGELPEGFGEEYNVLLEDARGLPVEEDDLDLLADGEGPSDGTGEDEPNPFLVGDVTEEEPLPTLDEA